MAAVVAAAASLPSAGNPSTPAAAGSGTGWRTLGTAAAVLGASAAAVYHCYHARAASAVATTQARDRAIRQQPRALVASDALLHSWRSARVSAQLRSGSAAADDAESEVQSRMPADELAAKVYSLAPPWSLVLAYRDNTGCGPDPSAARAAGEPLLDKMLRDARELLTAAADSGLDAGRWAVNDAVRAGGGAEKLCVAALVLNGLCEAAVDEFIDASISYEDMRDFCESMYMYSPLLPCCSIYFRTFL